MTILGLSVAAAAGTLAAGTLLIRNQNLLPLDIPNERSSHAVPKPRSGGMAIAGALALCAAIALATGIFPASPRSLALLASAAGFCALGIADDFHPLPEWFRLVAQLGLALAAVKGAQLSILSGREPAIAATVLTVVWIVGFVNAFNFMDGTDGLAVGKAAFAGVAIAALGGPPWILVAAAAALGLLPLNFQPSRIFLGDGGSYLLGFLLAAACAAGEGTSGGSLIRILPLGSFLADTSLTLARRILASERWYKAHRTHYYQQATALGFSHRMIALTDYGLTALGALAGIAILRIESILISAFVIGAWGAITVAPLAAVHLASRASRKRAVPGTPA